jgi:hypothetical protein
MARPDTPGCRWHRRQLDARVLEHLLRALRLWGALLDDDLAVAGQVAQLADRPGWHQARADQAVLDELADPGRIAAVGLAAGDVAQVVGVEQPALELVFQQVGHRFPGGAGGLHADHAHLQGAYQAPTANSPSAMAWEGTGLLAAFPVWARHADAGRDGLVVHVQPSATLDQLVHRTPPGSATVACPQEPVCKESESRARSNSSGCPRLPRPTVARAHRHQGCPTSPGAHPNFHPSGWPGPGP